MWRHEWESSPEVERAVHEELCGDGSERSDISEGSSSVERSASDELIDFCTHLYLTRDLTAKSFCTIMHWCGKAGIGPAALYGYNPDAPTGHFQRHLNKVMAFAKDKSTLYEFEVPSQHGQDAKRVDHLLTAVAPHEAFEEMIADDPTLLFSPG